MNDIPSVLRCEIATSFTLITASKSTAHQDCDLASVAMQLPTLSASGFLLPSTAKDAPRPDLTLDWKVNLPSAIFTGAETRARYNIYVCMFKSKY